MIHHCGESYTLADNPCLPRIIAATFGWESITIEYTDDEGQVHQFGACRMGRKVVMLPHFSYGPSAPAGVASKVIEALKVDGYSCEWRLFERVSEFNFKDKVSTFLPILTDCETQFAQLDANVRRKIRKSASNGITVKTGKSELLPEFYDIYSRNMHRLGSPALPRKWFAALLDQYTQGDALIACAYVEGKPAGAAFLLSYNGFNEACWFSTLSRYNKLYTAYALYWYLIQYTIQQKGNIFSFGRSSEQSGVHKFKQQWGGIDRPLVWNYSHPPTRNIRSFSFLPRVWKLLPFQLARFLGPYVAGRFY